MAEEKERQKQVDNLLAQDTNINDSEMREFRMQLEAALADLEQRGERLRKIAIRALLVYLAIAVILIVGQPPGAASIVAGILALLATVAMVVGGYATIIYIGKVAPTIRRLQLDSQNATIAELQQQVAALQMELHERPQPERNSREA